MKYKHQVVLIFKFDDFVTDVLYFADNEYKFILDVQYYVTPELGFSYKMTFSHLCISVSGVPYYRLIPKTSQKYI